MKTVKIVNKFGVVLVLWFAYGSTAAQSLPTSATSTSQPERMPLTLKQLRSSIGTVPSQRVIEVVSALDASVYVEAQSTDGNDVRASIRMTCLLNGGKVDEMMILVESKDKERWLREFAGLGPMKKSLDGISYVALADGVDLDISDDGKEISGTINVGWSRRDQPDAHVSPGPRARVSKTFQGLPVRYGTKASELIESLLKAKAKTVVLSPGNVEKFVRLPDEKVTGSAKLIFSDGRFESAELSLAADGLSKDARMSLVRELTRQDASGAGDKAVEHIDDGDAIVADNGRFVRVSWKEAAGSFSIGLAESDIRKSREADVMRLFVSLQGPLPSEKDLRRLLGEVNKLLDVLPPDDPKLQDQRKMWMDAKQKLEELLNSAPTTKPTTGQFKLSGSSKPSG